jgi:MFS family permease
MVNAARLLGPSIAGVLIAGVGEGACFAIDALSYVAVIISLVVMKVAPRPIARNQKRALADLVEGFRYAAGSVPIRSVLLLLALVSLMGMPYTVLMPAVASEVLHGGAGTLGLLMASSGLGALTGALYLASRSTVLGLGRIIGLCAAGFGVGLIAFSRSRSFWLSLLLMAPTGMAMMVQMAASNTVLQTIVDEDKRGRVMSFYAMAFFGTAPMGSLFAGAVADRFGAATAILAGGVACVVGALAFFRVLPAVRAATRPIYVKLGILPESAGSIPSELTAPPDG